MFKFNKIILIFILFCFCVSCNKELPVEETLLNKNWFFKSLEDTSWIPANVPGNIHTDLLESGIIEDPYYRLI